MIDHNVERLHISVDNAVRVSVVKGFQDFVSVKSNVHILECANEHFRFNVRDILKNEARCFADWIAHQVEKFDDIWAAVQSLQDFCFAVDLLRADWLQDFNHTRLIVH